ncbi:hypothetical protein [Enterococcus sp. DIV0174]|uniref:hypothetical protein n=1 Tax=Enterococcus sp. DIV0174 TaxID=2774785 RepID=UPI003D2FCF32
MNEVEQKLVDIKFILDMYNARADTSESTLDKIQKVLIPKTQLNDNQKEMFTRLVNNYSWFGSLVDHALYDYLSDSERTLSNKEFAQVLEIFSLWVMEQEGTE